MFFYKESVKHRWRMSSTMVVGGLFKLDKNIWAIHDNFQHHTWGKFIDETFGGQPCLWHGGRILSYDLHLEDYDKVKQSISGYTVRGIGCKLNFSAPDAGEFLDDEPSNILLDILAECNANGNHGVIVSDNRLRDYIRNRYPELKITASILKPLFEHPEMTDTPEYYNELSESYDYVVVRQDRNVEMGFLEKLRHKHKIELLVNSRCAPKCMYQALHYATGINIGRSIYGIAPEDRANVFAVKSTCRSRQANNFPMYIPPFRVDWLQEAGFTRFKLEGRELEWGEWCEHNLPYLAKPSFMSISLFN